MSAKSIAIFALFTLFSLTIVSCRNNPEIPAQPVVSFSNDVQSILIGNCTQSGCHGNKEFRRFSLTTYDQIMASGTVIAGDSHNSNLYKAITGRNNIMPKAPQSPLNDRQISYIYVWIAQGAKNN
ncbi:MAG: hypothetical protein NT126_07350 [Bacteroidetes bacterium]|nr:hypothetical protein [Bacteroidota bacterium]